MKVFSVIKERVFSSTGLYHMIFFKGCRHFSPFMIPVAGAPRTQNVSVFFFLLLFFLLLFTVDQNEIQLFSVSSFLWHITKLLERHSCCSQVFSSPICLLIFSLLHLSTSLPLCLPLSLSLSLKTKISLHLTSVVYNVVCFHSPFLLFTPAHV